MIHIKKEILIPIFLSIIIMMSVGATIVSIRLKESFVDEYHNHLETSAGLKKGMINLILDDIEHEMERFQNDSRFFSAIKATSEAQIICDDHSSEEECDQFFSILEKYFILSPQFVEMYVFDAQKQEVGHFAHPTRNQYIFFRTEDDVAKKLSLIDKKGNQQYFTDLTIENSGHPSMSAVTTLVDRGGLVGYLVMEINIDLFDEVLEGRVGLGATGETYLVGRNAKLRSNSRFYDRPTRLELSADTRNFKECFIGRNLTGDNRIFPDYRGTLVLGAHEYIDRLDWCLFAEIDQEEALETFHEVVYYMTIIILVILLVLYFIITLIAKKIERNVHIIE